MLWKRNKRFIDQYLSKKRQLNFYVWTLCNHANIKILIHIACDHLFALFRKFIDIFIYLTNWNLWCKMANKRCPQNQIQKKFHFQYRIISNFLHLILSCSVYVCRRKVEQTQIVKEIIPLLWSCYLISGNSIDFIIFFHICLITPHTHVYLWCLSDFIYGILPLKRRNERNYEMYFSSSRWLTFHLNWTSLSLGWQQHFFHVVVLKINFSAIVSYKILCDQIICILKYPFFCFLFFFF